MGKQTTTNVSTEDENVTTTSESDTGNPAPAGTLDVPAMEETQNQPATEEGASVSTDTTNVVVDGMTANPNDDDALEPPPSPNVDTIDKDYEVQVETVVNEDSGQVANNYSDFDGLHNVPTAYSNPPASKNAADAPSTDTPQDAPTGDELANPEASSNTE